jgi:hypothetical protein
MKRIIAGMLAITILAAPCAYDAFSPGPSPLSSRCQRFLASYKSDHDCGGSPPFAGNAPAKRYDFE